MDRKGEFLQNWLANKKNKNKQSYKATNKQNGFKLENLTCFCFFAENAVTNLIFAIKRKIVLTPSPFPPLSKVLESAFLCLWLNKKWNEVRNGLRMCQVGPDLHRLGWRGWCVVRGLKLTITGKWKFIVHVFYFKVWTVTTCCQLQKGQTNVHNSWILCINWILFSLVSLEKKPNITIFVFFVSKMNFDKIWIELTDFFLYKKICIWCHKIFGSGKT